MEKTLYYKVEPRFDGRYKIKELKLYRKGVNCFPTKEDALKHYRKAYKTAVNKYNQVMDAIAKIKEEIVDFRFDYYTDGDTYGIFEEGSYIEIIVENYEFRFLQ